MSVIKQTLAVVLVVALTAGTAMALQAASNTDDDTQTQTVQTLEAESLELDSNRHTHTDDLSPVTSDFTLDGYEKVGENEVFTLWLNRTDDAIRIQSKANGYIWGGVEKSTVEGLNKTWTDFANSIVSIEYFDAKNTERRIGISGDDCVTQYTMTDNGFTCRAEYTELELAFTFSVEVQEDGLHFAVAEDGLEEMGENTFKSIYFVPFFGTVKEDEKPGYMLVPDGSGALIRFQKAVKHLNGYEQRIYGKNFAIDALEEANDLQTSRPNDFSVEKKQALLPIYGMVNGIDQNAFLAVIGEGAEYASILATPAGVSTDFNWAACRFDVRQRYLQPTQKSGGGVWLPQAEPNATGFEMTMYFLSGEDANYSGMATLYREKLEQEGTLTRSERVDATVPVHLDFLGADVKKQFLVPGMQVFTTAEDVAAMVQELRTMGVGNITAVLKGFYGKGLNAASVSGNKLNSKLIDRNSYETLYDLLAEDGSRLYLYGNPVTANESQLSINAQAGNTMSKAYIALSSNNPNLMYTETYYVKASQVRDNMDKLAATDLPNLSLAFDNIGNRLYADYTRNRVTTRLQMEEEMVAAMAGYADTLENRAVYGGNLYLADYADDMFNVPLVGSQYLFESDSVPFLQMVYKGHVDMYGDYLNIGNLSRTKLLKMIEYGVYPSFILTWTDSTTLQDTPSEDLFSTAFADWKDRIAEIAKEMQQALSAFEGAKMLQHDVLEEGVVRVTYDNGKSLYINYTNAQTVADDVTLPAEGFMIKEG